MAGQSRVALVGRTMTDLVLTITEWFIEAPAIVWIIAAVIAVAAIARGKLR